MDNLRRSSREPPVAGCRTILVVDDDKVNRLLLKAMLRRDGFTVVEAADGRQAIEGFHEHRPDLILMDVKMPVLDGIEATREIKAASGERFTPVIFLTALTEETELARCLDSGGDDFLTKPYNQAILRAKIRALERMRRSHVALRDKNEQLALHHERGRQEQEIAKRVFANVVHAGCLAQERVRYLISPTAIFNGDLLLAARTPDGSLHVMLGDFTGHGLSASIGAMPVSDIFYKMTRNGFSVGEIAARTNDKLKRILPTGLFFAVCLLRVDLHDRSLTVWNGGIPDVLLYNETRGIRKRVRSKNLPLGILETANLDGDVDTVEVSEDDKILVYSDGLIESFNEAGEIFSEERLEAALLEERDPEQRFAHVLEALATFTDGAEQWDDITAIEIDCGKLGPPPGQPVESVPELGQTPFDWSLDLEFQADSLRNRDPVPTVLKTIMDMQGLFEHREHLFTILAELYSNALDHGLLLLDSAMKRTSDGFERYYQLREQRLHDLEGEIHVSLKHTAEANGGRLVITVQDSGPGFDTQQARLALAENRSNSGRGVTLVRNLCESLEYNDTGNRAEAVYRWHAATL